MHAPQLRHERFVGLYDAPAASYALHRFICGNLFHRCDVIDHDACTATDALMAVHQNGKVALGACGDYGSRLFENGTYVCCITILDGKTCGYIRACGCLRGNVDDAAQTQL